MNAKRKLAYAAVTACAVLTSGSGFSEGVKTMEPDVKTRLESLTEDMRENYLSDLMEERFRLQEKLLRLLLDEGQSDNIRFCAAYLLGMYKLDGAVDILARHIKMEQTKETPRDREALWGRYPVVEALVRIGLPSVPAMLRMLEAGSDEAARTLSAQVIRDIYGIDIAKQVIEKKSQVQTDQKKRQRLREALSLPFFAQ